MNSSGVMLEEYNYDPWGRRRNQTNWSYSNVSVPTYTNRGFTGHEHLDMFNLIHMNGRIYDPEIARFLSPDPFIQDPYNLLNYNRYSYCMNNPLKYVDPSGFKATTNDPGMVGNTNFGWLRYAPYGGYGGVDGGDYGGSGGSGGSGSNFWNLYLQSLNAGYDKGYGNFYVNLSEQTLAPQSRNSQMTFTWNTWENSNYVEGGSVYICSKKIIHSVTLDIGNSNPQGGGGNSAYNDVPGWVDKANTGVGAFMVGNNAKEQLISYASRTGDIGKAGVKYLKVVRSTGVAGSLFGMGVSGYNIYNDYSQGGIEAVNGWDVADFGVGAAGLGATIFLVTNPVGWVISGGVAIYFTVRLIHDATTED